MYLSMSRCLCRGLRRNTVSPRLPFEEDHHAAPSQWFAQVMTLKTSASLRYIRASDNPQFNCAIAVPKKKKKVDPKREQMARERLKKKLKKLEKVAPELIPIEDYITPIKSLDETRARFATQLSFEERERRALLLKEWSKYKRTQHMAEAKAIEHALEAQRQALEELKLESEELYIAALKPDPSLLPFTYEGPTYTPPIKTYDAPDGKYNNITKVYTQ